MKIAFLNIYQGVVSRGAENFAKEISSRLSETHQVDIYSALGKITEEKARSQTPLTLWGKILYKFNLDSHSRRVLFFTLSVLPKILKGKYDWTVSVDGGWQLLILKLVQLMKLGRFKILVSGQAGIGRDDLRNLRMSPDVFVSLTKRAQLWARGVNSNIKIVYIPNGADLEKFSPKTKPAIIGLEKPIVICVAGLNPYKRVDLTIKAISSLARGGLLLLGDGPERDRIDELGNKLLGDRRYLRTTVSYDDIDKYYASADLFTLVSESSEAFGSAYIEAMACGLPVVATDDQMRHEIVGDAGLFVDPTNIDKYAGTLEQALKTDWGDKPRQQAEKFSWDKIAKEYEMVMENFPDVSS
jgi:glycosyltransferase involved in cell wall biosynthesis